MGHIVHNIHLQRRVIISLDLKEGFYRVTFAWWNSRGWYDVDKNEAILNVILRNTS